MAAFNSIINIRKFIVKGRIECSFFPDSTDFFEEISNLEVELWQKSPLDVFFLGKGITETSGDFVITFEVNNETSYIKDGIIKNVFAKVYYKGEIISGENPYINDDVSPSNRPIKNITLREGVTDIGKHIIKITPFEYPVNTAEIGLAEKPAPVWNNILFNIVDNKYKKPIPTGYTCEFKGFLNVGVEEYILFKVTTETMKEGYVELTVPILPFVTRKSEDAFNVDLTINGIPASSSEECFLKITVNNNTFYTPVTNLTVYNDLLSVYSDETYYPIENIRRVKKDITILYFSEHGEIIAYDTLEKTWENYGSMTFYQIQYPENLATVSDGIYQTTSNTGSVTAGQLGQGTFNKFSLSVENRSVVPINLNLAIIDPYHRKDIFTGFFSNLLPGSKNFTIIETEEFPVKPDDSPTLSEIEAISGTSFSTTFRNFLTSKGLTTLEKLKKAGPVRYIEGLPSRGITDEEVSLLQSHVDLYSINQNIDQNQHLFNQQYRALYQIADTPKDEFIKQVTDEEKLPLYHAAHIHETIVQTQKLVTNLLSAKLTDYELVTPFIPDLPNSTFANTAFSKFINRCECEDCTSAVSPFSYLVDLLKYGAKHIKKTGTPSYNPVNYNAFLTLLENYFFQPFGSFSVDCDTLHKEYCRMRLVTEILDHFVSTKTLPVGVTERLDNDRKNFILLTYKTLLTQAGTSYEELRTIITIQDEEEQKIIARRLSDKLGIPLYVPGSVALLTAKRMWLTFGNPSSDQELNAENLELIFGFRDTQRNVLTNPPASLIAQWKESYLFELWKSTDFLFSAYSREDVDPADDTTFKPEWKPIIDPDSFGRGDMTYQSSDFALALWRHRKADTDAFLSRLVSDTTILSRTSVDMRGRVLRIPGKNLNGVQFQNDEIRIENPSDNQFVAFKVYTTVLNGANTDIVLKKSTPDVTQHPLFQPEGTNPVMRYDSVVQVVESMTAGTTSVTLDWNNTPVLLNKRTNGRVQLISKDSDDEETYIYDPSATVPPVLEITSVTVISDSKVTLVVSPQLSEEFVNRTISFVYEAEVALDTATIPDPEKICDALFTIDNFDYTYLSPAPAGMNNPFKYTVWDEPNEWPDPVNHEPTNYRKLKKLYQIIRSGTTSSDYLDIVTNALHTDPYSFNLVMELLISCEQYLDSMYSYDKPDMEQFYQMAAIFRISARQKLNENWVNEEIKHIPSGGIDPERLMLNARFFWKSLNEPQAGQWNSSLQTIPDNVLDIDASDIPIIDPESVPRQNLLRSPDANAYRELYDARQQQLNNQREIYFSWISSYEADGFKKILNHINTGDENEGYNLEPEYDNLKELIHDFESTDVFRQLKATTVLQHAFALTPDAFSVILPVMNAYQDENPSNQPGIAELHTVTDLFVTACKQKQFYFTGVLGTGWIEEEVTGNFPDGEPVKYYNVLDMRMDPVLGNVINRSEWQHTLAKWNRVPTVFPDIVPPENIRHFVQGEVVHDRWIVRKNSLDLTYDQASSIFNGSLTAGTLFQNYKLLLNTLITRTDAIVNNDYYLYLTALFNKEGAGTDIRPYLNQLNIQITEYKVLKQVYDVLENETEADPLQFSNLLSSEYDDVINIFIRVSFANAGYFRYVVQEYDYNIVLNGTDFQNYTPAIINFPLDLVQETVQWRSPNAEKKTWKDTLNTRIERKQSALDEWETTLEETEGITMPVMRDALIQALRINCESLENTAERLAKMLFIETKDNCCVKHSRVSHALETLQGFIFSLESGIYDNYLNGFTLTAPNFNKEWQWLGSYATWRSAVFTYIYPENLLYPTLKKRQSPAFIELAETIQNANRFTPLNACQAAKKYQEYFEDIQNLKLVCTANADAYIYRKNPLDCCGDLNNNIKKYMTFYVAQSTISGKGYYSEKPYYATDSNEHDFWKAIPTLREGAKIIGCLPLNRGYDDDGQATDTALWLFFTYREEGELKLAYLKKDLMTAGSEWTEEEDIELPDIFETTYKEENLLTSNRDYIDVQIVSKSDQLTRIIICQNSTEWDFVHFIFSYERANGTKRHIQIRWLAQNNFFDKAIGSMLFFDNNTYPFTAIRHQITNDNVNSNELIGITVVFEDEIQTGYYGNLSGYVPVLPVTTSFVNLIGAFKKNNSSSQFIVANRDSSGETRYTEYYFTYTVIHAMHNPNAVLLAPHQHPLTISEFDKNILSIAPRFNASDWESANAVTVYTNNTLTGVTFIYATDALESDVIFALAPERIIVPEPIVSGECVDNFNTRAAKIKEHMRLNLNAPQGSPVGAFYRTSAIKEVLYEAYYFVPMLIALDQQQRGEYSTALDWYRSVYDYTNDLSHKRKIFYGLVLEQSITNVFDRPADWLLDPLNPHLIAQTRTNAYTKYTLMNIIQCMLSYGDREFTIDTIETVPTARKLYTESLSLMKVSELNVKPSQCYTKSHACFQTVVDTTSDLYWNNSFEELQTELENLNDVTLIEQASGVISGIFNSDDSMEEKFTSAFTYLSLAVPRPAQPDTVTGLIDGVAERMNDAYRYLFADIDTQPFNTAVEAHFTNTLATLTSQTPQEAISSENVNKIEWLKEPAANNAEPLTFRFINKEGIQFLKKDVAYDPLHPSPAAFQSNLVFSNATVLYAPFLYEEDFTPFVDYAFCLPSNPVYSALELKANLELFKIHNCRNIAGMERSLDIFAAPTDSTTGVPVIGADGNLILPGTGAIIPSQYRFRVLMERAKQLVAQAQQLESQFLATLEKEDAENYSQLRARQDLQTAKSTVKLQDMRVKQALNEETIADLQLDKMQFVQNTYNDWISAGLNGYESASLSLLGASAVMSGIAAAVNFGTFWKIESYAQGLANIASTLSTISSMMSQLASYQRRQEEWQYQSDLAGYDISIANQQIKIAQQNTRIVSQEREIASLNMGHATDTLEFLKTKFTNAELYRWMGNVLERTYSYMLSLATAVAKTAEQQYYFEQQQQSGPFILDDYWEVPQTGSLALTSGGVDRRGLTGSARLLQDITKLDQYAFETTKRKLQMTRVISLGQLYPDAFQTFRQTGVLNFDLTNRLFDYDFPGHYLRLINTVKVSVIGLIPVYDNIKATLTAGTTSYTVINANNTFQQVPIRRMETDQVALTGASRATGIFEFQAAQGEFLNPFEGMGIESRWEFKMPRFSNRMDYSTIADVLIEVDYTALDSFQYRYQVLQEIDNTLGFSRGFSFKNDYPDQWYELAEVQESDTEFSVEIELKRDQFPQGIENIRLDGSSLLLHFVRKDGFTNEVSITDFSLVTTAVNSQPMSGITVDGTFNATALTNVLSTQTPASPFVKLRLAFANTALNRELFSQEQVTDILLLVNCKADLPVYPL